MAGKIKSYEPKHMGSFPTNLQLTLLTLPFIEPQLFKVPAMSFGDTIYAGIKAISSVMVLYLYLKHRSMPKRNRFLLVVMALELWIGISTVVCSGSMVRYLGPAITAVTMIMVSDLALHSDIRSYLQSIRSFLSAMVCLNALTMILMRLGLWPFPVPLMGIDNRWIYVLLPWVTTTFLIDEVWNGSISNYSWLSLAITLLMLISVWSVGAMISCSLWIPVWFLAKWHKARFGRPPCLTPIFTLFFVLNILILSGHLLPLMKPLISAVLKKDITLAGRTYLWETVLNILKKSPLFGEGVQSSRYDINMFFSASGGVIGTAVNHPHNYILNVALHGGIIAAALFIAAHGLIAYQSDKALSRKSSATFTCFFVCYFTASLVDTLDYSLFYLLLSIAYSGIQQYCVGNRNDGLLNQSEA